MWVMVGIAMVFCSAWIITTVLLFNQCWFNVYAVLLRFKKVSEADYQLALKRMVRHAEFQERIIAADGSFSPFGRSITYRTGAFQILAQTALMRRASVPRWASGTVPRIAGSEARRVVGSQVVSSEEGLGPVPGSCRRTW